MILSVHQPQYLPWLGYFHKIIQSDAFVFLDNVQYKKREFQNRNKIRTKTGWMWLTVPVVTKDRYDQKINQVEIESTSDWRKDHWRGIECNYSGAKYFSLYKDPFKKIYDTDWGKLSELNVEIIKLLLKILDIKTSIYFESELNVASESTQRIVDISKHFKADVYLSGVGGKDYLEETLFEQANIKLAYQNFVHPEYQQYYQGFEPYMSVIDLIFNCGEESQKILCTKNTGT